MQFPDSSYWIHVSVLHCSFLLLFYLCGQIVSKYSVRVNYTRKIMHFALFFLPQSLLSLFPYQTSVITAIINAMLTMCVLGLFVQPLRERFVPLGIMFRAIDRPEDRPYTLLWLVTQFLASYVVIMPLVFALEQMQLRELLAIPILIIGVGDGLAEPVGIRFGKHHYQTRAIFSQRKYTRSIEGSLCVFIVSILAICYFNQMFSDLQFVTALAVIPIVMTITEALSPHTWDSPFLYLIGGMSLIFVLQV
ncbi:MAG: hypothetical protein K0U68_11535 [Gammaproteobacteria bacterium]|nr:hypothetical protein [Gammaproteobacteria bacterium]